jgi:hypothetical protein
MTKPSLHPSSARDRPRRACGNRRLCLHGVEHRPEHERRFRVGTISGYTISGVAYNLNSSNPNNIDSVAFTIAPRQPAP